MRVRNFLIVLRAQAMVCNVTKTVHTSLMTKKMVAESLAPSQSEVSQAVYKNPRQLKNRSKPSGTAQTPSPFHKYIHKSFIYLFVCVCEREREIKVPERDLWKQKVPPEGGLHDHQNLLHQPLVSSHNNHI